MIETNSNLSAQTVTRLNDKFRKHSNPALFAHAAAVVISAKTAAHNGASHDNTGLEGAVEDPLWQQTVSDAHKWQAAYCDPQPHIEDPDHLMAAIDAQYQELENLYGE